MIDPSTSPTPSEAEETSAGAQGVDVETSAPGEETAETEKPMEPVGEAAEPTATDSATEADSEPVATSEVEGNSPTADSAETEVVSDPEPPAVEEPITEEAAPSSEEPAVVPETTSDPEPVSEDTAGPDEDEEAVVQPPGDAVAEENGKQWFVLKVTTNRENSIKDNLLWRFRRDGLEEHLGQVVIPNEKVKEKTKSGKTRTITRKLYPGYMMIQMELNEDTWFLVRDTPGVGDFTGAAGKPVPMTEDEVARMLNKPLKPRPVPTTTTTETEGDETVERVVVNVPYNVGETVKIKEGSFAGFEGVVDAIDPETGKTNVLVQILGQATPVELEYYQVETV